MAWFDRYLERAAGVALSGDPRRNALVGCVALRQDGAVVVATNVRTKDPHPHAHAEWRALRKAGRGAILFVARVTRDGALACAKPCLSCQRRIERMKARVFHT